jgi:DNA-binding FadR family transcriptional regulator
MSKDRSLVDMPDAVELVTPVVVGPKTRRRRDALPPKRASTLANTIESEIFDRGWPVGELIGSEAELMSRYEVSRSIFREAVRLLEQREVAVMRRGPYGGLTVVAPEASAVGKAAATFLRFNRVDVPELLEARVDLELSCLRLAIDRLTESGLMRLREVVAAEEKAASQVVSTESLRNFHLELAALTQNRPLWLFVSILNTLQGEFSPKEIPAEGAQPESKQRTGSGASHEAHQAILRAIEVGDVGLAMHRMRRHLEASALFSSAYVDESHGRNLD